MSIETTLYDLVNAVSAECEDNDQVVSIIQDLINAGKVELLRSSKKMKIIPSQYLLEDR